MVRLVRSLQQQAPDQVHLLMGNHESLMLGRRLFPRTTFTEVWRLNGGRPEDQEALTDDDEAWLRGLPLMARVGDHLLVHSDTVDYLTWGESVQEVNATVRTMLAGDDPQTHWDVFASLTTRFDFAGPDGTSAARRMLDTFGGRQIVHGHSIISTLTGGSSSATTGPYEYADGLALAIDGGRYDGGPLLVVRLD